jgi:hypothetical protein
LDGVERWRLPEEGGERIAKRGILVLAPDKEK